MSFLIGLLTVVIVFNCLFLILLILIQLPKKEAGAGVAFGGGAADALFGAGSGNALTKLTKYAASIFVGLALVLSLLNSKRAEEGNRKLEDLLRQQAAKTSAQVPPSVPGNEFAVPKMEDTNVPPQTSATNSVSTNLPAAATNIVPVPSTNRPAPASTNQTPAPAISPAPAATTIPAPTATITPTAPTAPTPTPVRPAATNQATTNPAAAPKQ